MRGGVSIGVVVLILYSSLLAEVTPGQVNEHVFETRLPGGEVLKSRPALLHGREKHGNGDVRLTGAQDDLGAVSAGG